MHGLGIMQSQINSSERVYFEVRLISIPCHFLPDTKVRKYHLTHVPPNNLNLMIRTEFFFLEPKVDNSFIFLRHPSDDLKKKSLKNSSTPLDQLFSDRMAGGHMSVSPGDLFQTV